MNATDKSEIRRIVELQQRNRQAVRQSTAADRIAKLKALRRWIRDHRPEIREALYQDLRKPADEADLWEMYAVIKEITYAVRHLRRWMKPRRIPRDLFLLNARSSVVYEPKGHVLLIAPWNFPFLLAMGPLVSALSAGNCIILKPSELAPHTSRIIWQMMHELFPPDEISVLEGDKEVAAELLKYPFDHIFFTGGTRIGRMVMQAAAENLSSLTLELGGKCPVIVDASANMRDSVAKIAWGKFSNAGQTCVAPDYVLVAEEISGHFISELVREIDRRYACRERDPETAFDGMASIVDEKHFRRLQELYDDAVKQGATVVTGGFFEPRKRCLTPTVLTGIPPQAKIFSEEVFGPILPVLTFSSSREVLDMINRNGHPLGVYVFSRSDEFKRMIMQHSNSGGICFNELVIQFVHSGLPFGGAGKSGFGRAHGYAGFREFSNERSVLKGNKLSPMKLILPPVTPFKQKLIDIVYRYF
jgi:aldehyde dehydrogenase (NAD+)